jgi:hypothetical protein
VVIIFPAIYRQAWLKARAIRRRHKPLSDEFLWHDVYNFYAENLPRLTPEAELDIVRAWQVTGDELARARLLEAFYYIVRPIAGQIATKRFPPPLKRRGWPSTVSVFAFTSWPRSAYLGCSWRLTASIWDLVIGSRPTPIRGCGSTSSSIARRPLAPFRAPAIWAQIRVAPA